MEPCLVYMTQLKGEEYTKAGKPHLEPNIKLLHIKDFPN